MSIGEDEGNLQEGGSICNLKGQIQFPFEELVSRDDIPSRRSYRRKDVELESEVPNLHPCQMQTPINFCASCFTLGK